MQVLRQLFSHRSTGTWAEFAATQCAKDTGGAMSTDQMTGREYDAVWTNFMFSALRAHIRLLFILLLISFLGAVAVYVFFPPAFTATAVVGPPAPSPTEGMLQGGTGLVARLGSGAGVSSSDPYREFLQLIPSTRLCQVLIERDHILQRIFHQKWDAKHNRWNTSWLHQISSSIKRALGWPESTQPNVDDLLEFLKRHLQADEITSGTGLPSALMPLIPTFTQVSFAFDDPSQAQQNLAIILSEADQIIREDQRRDVLARIQFLERELARVTVADERDALIQTISSQEQLLAMLQSDQRYASALIVPAYAPLVPTFPPPVRVVLLTATAIALIAWFVLVSFAARSRRIDRLIRFFERRHTADARLKSPDAT
jgi:hypothetical protein